MSHAWFDILSSLPNESVQNLKKDLSGRTLIGEYVGNQDY